MKKLLKSSLTALAVVGCFFLVGCGNNDGNVNPTVTPTPADTSYVSPTTSPTNILGNDVGYTTVTPKPTGKDVNSNKRNNSSKTIKSIVNNSNMNVKASRVFVTDDLCIVCTKGKKLANNQKQKLCDMIKDENSNINRVCIACNRKEINKVASIRNKNISTTKLAKKLKDLKIYR